MMLDTLLSRPATRARWSSGPLSSYLEDYAAQLAERGLKLDSIAGRLRAAVAFGRWLSDRHLTAADVDELLVEQYVESTRSESSGRIGKTAVGLRSFVALVRAHEGVDRLADSSPSTPAERFLGDYRLHLETARGLAPRTLDVHLRFARRFIALRFDAGPIEWSAVTADDVVAFIRQEASGRTGHGPKGPASSVRVLLRFLCQRGLIRDGLQGAVPRIRIYKQAHLPERLTTEEVERTIGVWTAADEASLRSRAILLLLARLGLRAQEVRHLHLEDIDWAEGRLLVRPGKTHSERSLPLPEDVGAALVAYLKDGRPPSRSRYLFLTLRPPRGPIQDSCVISRLVGRSLERAGISSRSRAAHILRHTVASQMVSAGATFKDVADVLGHRSLATTEVYAKLDVAALSRIALPWPGGVR